MVKDKDVSLVLCVLKEFIFFPLLPSEQSAVLDISPLQVKGKSAKADVIISDILWYIYSAWTK